MLLSVLAFLVLPGIAAVIVPPLLALLDPWKGPAFLPGLYVMFLGSVILLWCVRDFFVSGKGTLAPWDPPGRLVTVGLYRHTRNPMYIGVLLLVAGWSVYFASIILTMYSVILAAGFHRRIIAHEEPWLRSQFGAEWDRYRTDVPRWLPRLQPRKSGS